MNRTLQPIETEYSGVVFRSKTEAVFARCLDLAGAPWTYEPVYSRPREYEIQPKDIPPGMEIEGESWTPDFRISIPNKWRHRPGKFLNFTEAIIELKPKEPTDSYIKTTAEKYFRLLDYYEQEIAPLIIMWGMWDGDVDCWFFPFPPDDWIHWSEMISRLGSCPERWRPVWNLVGSISYDWRGAISHRFDLK